MIAGNVQMMFFTIHGLYMCSFCNTASWYSAEPSKINFLVVVWAIFCVVKLNYLSLCGAVLIPGY